MRGRQRRPRRVRLPLRRRPHRPSNALGVDPADGTLYAATHYGLFVIPTNGTASRVGNRFQDTMGFTIAGPHDFLGSGHPDPKEATTPRLGLIESGDGGKQWRTLSLSGAADFHALHVDGQSVYGWDSGTSTFQVTTDRVTWQTRSTLPLVDFALNPANSADVLVTQDSGIVSPAFGLIRSADGGRRFTPVKNSPKLVVLSWPKAGELTGLTDNGDLLHSADGTTWTKRGSLHGFPQALTSYNGTLYAAIQDTGIFVSTDGGTNWTLRYHY